MFIFLAIAIMFFIIMVGGFLFGHDHDHDHDHSGMDHGDSASEHTVSIFSIKVIATFGMGFGAAGAVAMHLGCSYLMASGWGVLAGLVLGVVMWLFLSVISKQQASSVVSAGSYIGLRGVVTVAIDPGETGEVGISTPTGYINRSAMSDDGSAIPKGAQVVVRRAEAGTLFVEAKK